MCEGMLSITIQLVAPRYPHVFLVNSASDILGRCGLLVRTTDGAEAIFPSLEDCFLPSLLAMVLAITEHFGAFSECPSGAGRETSQLEQLATYLQKGWG